MPSLFPGEVKEQHPDLELKKHVATVWMTGITPVHRRLWNVLTYNAYHHLEEREEHRVPVTRIIRDMNLNSRNYEYIKNLLRELVNYNVEWDVLGTTGRSIKWGTTNMLAAAEMERGFVTYSYSPPMRRALKNPEMYALISLTVQNDFKTEYAPVIYEMVVQIYSMKDGRSYGSWIPLTKFRDMIGLGQDKYDRFTDFRRYVVEKALKEITGKTPFRVTADYDNKDGRSYDHIKLHVEADRRLEIPTLARAAPVPKVELGGKAARFALGQAWQAYEALSSEERQNIAAHARQKVENNLRRNHPHLFSIYRRDGINSKQINPIYKNKIIEVFLAEHEKE